MTNGKLTTLLTLGMLLGVLTCHAEPDSTDPRLYHPYNKAPYQVTPEINANLKGYCLEQSGADQRKDAWKCVANQTIYDPCFTIPNTNPQKLICPNSPWEAQATLLQVQGSLDNSSHAELDMSTSPPWALELLDGTRCLILTEKHTHQGETLSYYCNGNRYLLGRLKRCYNFWQIYLRDGPNFHLVKIKRAWF